MHDSGDIKIPYGLFARTIREYSGGENFCFLRLLLVLAYTYAPARGMVTRKQEGLALLAKGAEAHNNSARAVPIFFGGFAPFVVH